MAKTFVLDELHITLRIPSGLPDSRSDELGVTLRGAEFMSRLRRAIRTVVRGDPELNVVRVSLSR
ncbi:MAG: hypothetical protein C0467_28775 [Planctomycetaceae bacterium]|nr:hypothetical protein [Planctomycetaceae bacterium]